MEKNNVANDQCKRLPNSKIFPESPLEAAVRGGEVHEITRSIRIFEKILEDEESPQGRILNRRCTAEKTLGQIMSDALSKMKDLQDYLEVGLNANSEANKGEEEDSEGMSNADEWKVLFSHWARFFANLRLLKLAFQMLNGLSLCFQQISEILACAAVLLRLHSNSMVPIRYLIKFPTKSPLLQIFILLQVMRMLALVGMIRSAYDLSKMIIGCTKGSLRKDAVSGIEKIRQVFIEPHLNLEINKNRVAA